MYTHVQVHTGKCMHIDTHNCIYIETHTHTHLYTCVQANKHAYSWPPRYTHNSKELVCLCVPVEVAGRWGARTDPSIYWELDNFCWMNKWNPGGEALEGTFTDEHMHLCWEYRWCQSIQVIPLAVLRAMAIIYIFSASIFSKLATVMGTSLVDILEFPWLALCTFENSFFFFKHSNIFLQEIFFLFMSFGEHMPFWSPLNVTIMKSSQNKNQVTRYGLIWEEIPSLRTFNFWKAGAWSGEPLFYYWKPSTDPERGVQ